MAYTAEERNQAFIAFRERQKIQTPPPSREIAERVNLVVVIALILIALSAGWVSATRTVEGFANSYQGTLDQITSAETVADLQPDETVRLSVGIAAFIMLEIGIATYSFMSIRMSGGKKLNNTKRYITIGQWASIVIVCLEALHVVFKGAVVGREASAFEGAVIGITSTLVPVMLALAPPALLFVSFELLAIIYIKNKTRQAELDRQHQDAMKEWNDAVVKQWSGAVRGAFMREWTANEHRTKRTDTEQTNTERTPNRHRTRGEHRANTSDHKRTKQEQVEQFLRENPDLMSMSVREIKDYLEAHENYRVGITTISLAVRAMQNVA